MNDLLRRLVELTEVDRELVKTGEQLAKFPAMLTKMEAEEAEARRTIEEAGAALKTARQSRQQAEKEVGGLREKIQKFQSQQTSVKTNKEYEAITHEIEGTRGKIDEWETRGLEELMREERAQDRRDAAQKKLEALLAAHAAERDRIENQQREKTERIADREAERARRVAALPDDWQEQYILLNERFPGTASVKLEGESCGGCHWHLVAQTVQEVRAGEGITECEHCRRILYASDRSN
jgi:hypothetical protein